jgi:acetoacetyl-CoA synthetase
MLEDFLAPYAPGDIDFQPFPFNHPLYILYSSGTTGAPKCIVHGVGGSLLQHLKEHLLHGDVKPGTRLFYFTTCGWMMWNWLASALAAEATLLLYDGSPFHPDGNVLFDFAEATGMNTFGTSAKFIDALMKAELEPAKSHDLGTVKRMLSTGSPLSPQGFEYVYEKVKPDIHLGSMSGGTDLIGCFVGPSPMLPVWRGEIQAPMLAMDVRVFDDDGNTVVGEQGELVCAQSFPSVPLGFWKDPDDVKFREAYFDVYPDTWCHGDWVETTERGGMIIYGRSDATPPSAGA